MEINILKFLLLHIASQSPFSQGLLCSMYTIHNKYSVVSWLKWRKKCLHITHTRCPTIFCYRFCSHENGACEVDDNGRIVLVTITIIFFYFFQGRRLGSILPSNLHAVLFFYENSSKII